MGTQIRTTLDPNFQEELDGSPLAPDDISRAVAMFVEERVFTLQQLGRLPEKEFDGLMNEQQPRLQRGIKVVLKDLWSSWHKWAEQKKKEEELAQKERIREEEKLKRLKEKEEMKLQAADMKRRMQEEARQQKQQERERQKEQERLAREKAREEEKLARQAAKEKAKEEERLRREEEKARKQKERASSAKGPGRNSSAASAGRRQSFISSYLITANGQNGAASPGKASNPPEKEEVVGSAEPSWEGWRDYWRKARRKFNHAQLKEWDARRFVSSKKGGDTPDGSQSSTASEDRRDLVAPSELDTKGVTTALYAFEAAKPADSRQRYSGRRKPRCVFVDLDERDRPPVQLIITCESKAVSGRNPLGKDPALDYEIDSDAEWAEQAEGEDLGDDDDESEDDETASDADSCVVSDGKLSADEMSEDEECAAAERELIKKKSKKRRSAGVLATACISLAEIDAAEWPPSSGASALLSSLRETVINDFTIDILDQNLIDAPGEDDPKPTAQSTTAGSRGPQQGGVSGEGPMKSPSGSDAGQPSDSDANGGAKSQQQRKKVWSDIKLRRKLAKFVHASSMALGKLKQGFEEQHPQCAGCGTAAQIKRIAKYERRGTNSCMAWWVTQEAIKELKLQPKTMENLAEKRSWSLHRSVPLQPRKRRKPGPPPPPTSRETANSGSGEGGGESGEGGGSSSDGGGGEGASDGPKQDAKRMRRITDYFPAKSATPGPKDTPLAASTPVPDPAPPPVDVPQEAAQPPAVEADMPPVTPL
ncbi:hypothetical protein FOZ60_011010 [Perkinsus olseni]|uniref:Chromatin assembly factor 1 subunit A dimerization domain-containing protein n=4 Tax=Perkinsus olseni TaxID=32597 RepID=A0A7J6NE34_PEROL|nr:hypothetical protein FOZ60_011010 [Perkinsus olseni]